MFFCFVFYLPVFLKGWVSIPSFTFTAEIKTWVLINTCDLFLCDVGVMTGGEQEEEDIHGGVSDERQLEIRRKRKKIQEKLSNGEKNVISLKNATRGQARRTSAVSKGVRTAQ